MSKRGASDQITRENHLDHESDDEPKSIKLASASVLAKRKILKPRGRTPGSSMASSASPAPSIGSNATGNSGLFGNATAQDGLKGTEQPGVKSFTFGSSQSSGKSDDKNEKIKALNTQFVAILNKNHKEGHVANFTEAAKKYIEYYDKIERGEVRIQDNSWTKPALESKSSQSLFGNATKPDDQPTPVVKPQPAVETKPESDSSSDSEDEIKVEGPKFTLNAKPTAQNSPFSFGPKPAKKVDSESDSESEVEIKGPTFNFNKPIKDNVFKLDGAKSANSGSNNSTSTQINDSKPAFTFGSSTAGKNDEPKPAFSFGASTAGKNDEPKPAFSFGASATEKKDEPKPAFSFGGSAEKKDEPKHAFSFGASAEKNDEPKSAFSFGASSFGASATEKKDESKPAFTFGASAEKKDEPKPAVSFGTSAEKKDESKPLFSFGTSATATEKKDEPKPAFSFGSSTEKKDESKPAFSFGSTTNGENKVMFSGSSTSDSTPKPFSFGSENKDTKEEKPKSSLQFSFNPPSQTSSEKPAFSFGSSNSGTPLFGKNNSTPSFTFNANNNKNEAESNSATPETQQEADPSEEDTGGNFKAVAQLSSEKLNNQTGEEDEEALYTKRSKLMLFDPSNSENPYTSKGLGDLKVLKNKATGKSRIVVRAEGGLRILLNTLVNKDMVYTTIGNGSMVRVPTVNPTDESIETYILKVKTADDGQKLLEVLNDARK